MKILEGKKFMSLNEQDKQQCCFSSLILSNLYLVTVSSFLCFSAGPLDRLSLRMAAQDGSVILFVLFGVLLFTTTSR